MRGVPEEEFDRLEEERDLWRSRALHAKREVNRLEAELKEKEESYRKVVGGLMRELRELDERNEGCKRS